MNAGDALVVEQVTTHGAVHTHCCILQPCILPKQGRKMLFVLTPCGLKGCYSTHGHMGTGRHTITQGSHQGKSKQACSAGNQRRITTSRMSRYVMI